MEAEAPSDIGIEEEPPLFDGAIGLVGQVVDAVPTPSWPVHPAGPEMLVGDIIRTLATSPTIGAVAALAGIVFSRTFSGLSWSWR